jgi:opacity protein-like surface antigen
MKRNYLFMALAVMAVGALVVSVAAQTNLFKLPVAAAASWLSGSAAPQTVKINPPAFNAAQPSLRVHDGDHDYPTSGTFNNTLSNAQVSQHQDGGTVVLITAQGELPGTLTLKLDLNGTAIVGGEWAFNVSYTEVRHIEDPEPGGEDHVENLIQRGMLKGVISGGQVTLGGANNTVGSINSVQLTVNGGTMSFHQADDGSGAAQASNIQNGALSSGTMTLSF